MGTINYILPLLFAFLLTACQVKEPKANGGLISGHAPTTNKFTIQPLATKTYVANETINFTLTFPFEMEITGTPRLRLVIGSNTRYANYVAGSDLKRLNFTYAFITNDNDTNGIDVAALELNGAILQFDQAGTLTNCDVSTITNTNFSGVRVDTAVPTIDAFNLMNIPGLYHPGDKINFVFTFSEPVFVTGSPKFRMTLGATNVDVLYVGGSSSNILAFSYTITAADASDGDGFEFPNPIDVGTGSIKDAVGNNATLTFADLAGLIKAQSVTVRVNGQYPYVIGMQVPENGTYLSAKNLDFILEFDKPVTVTNTPYLVIKVGTAPGITDRNATYVSGSGTKFLTFRYTTVPGDVDTDGIELAPAIVQDTGDIAVSAAPTVSFFTDPLNNVIEPPSMIGVILSSLRPQPISIARNIDLTSAVFGTALDNVWIIGQEIKITIGFNTGIFVNTTMGTPTIQMNIGGITKNATYLSGGDGQTSLIFTYTIVEGDLDMDGEIDLGDIVLNGATMIDGSNTVALLTLPDPKKIINTKFDGVRPVINTVTPPTAGTYSSHVNMNFLVNWSEPVQYDPAGTRDLQVSINGAVTSAPMVGGNETATITHRPALSNQNGDVTISSPITGTRIVRDQAGNTAVASGFTFSAPDTTGVIVDTIAPKVISIVPVAPTDPSGTYKQNDILYFTVTFDEEVTITRSGSYPRIQIRIGASNYNAIATSNGTGTTHTFSYTIPNNRNDTDGIQIMRFYENNGTFRAIDKGLNEAIIDPGFSAVQTGIIIDTRAPSITSTSGTPSGTYRNGNTIQITLNYDEAVIVDETLGTPFIPLSFTDGEANLNYVSGSGTTTLVFSRILDADHFEMNGLSGSITTVNLNGGVLKDQIGNPADRIFDGTTLAIDFSEVYVTYPKVKLWVKNDFINMAPAGGATINRTGEETYVDCGDGICRKFDGDDSLSTPAMTNIGTVFMIVKMPNPTPDLVSIGDVFDIFDVDVVLKGDPDTNAYDLTTSSSTFYLNGSLIGGAVNRNLDLEVDSTNLFQLDFNSVQNYSGVLIQTSFTGAIGEMIAIEPGLDSDQKTNIKNYLDARY